MYIYTVYMINNNEHRRILYETSHIALLGGLQQGEMAFWNFCLKKLFSWPICEPGITQMPNLCSMRRHRSPVVSYGGLKFFASGISPTRAKSLAKLRVSNISSWFQRDSDPKKSRFLVMTFNFVWNNMERNHGFICIELSNFLSEISSDFCEYHSTHAK